MLSRTVTELEQQIAAILKRAPEWLRRDLCSDDRQARTRAEDAMAALIAAGIRRAG